MGSQHQVVGIPSAEQQYTASKPCPQFPPVRACIFDMDGLLINSEDMITNCLNHLLEKYGRPNITGSIRAQIMGIPDSTNGDVFHNWARLPISRNQFALECAEQMQQQFPNCKPLPGAEQLLSTLSNARGASSASKIELALASTTTKADYTLKASRPETEHLLGFFCAKHRILGDNPRVPAGRSKPAPDIYLLALESLNSSLSPGAEPILPSECLVFEDSVIGVEAGRRAGMRVIWVPHPDLVAEYQSRLKEVLAGRTGIVEIGNHHQRGEIDDGWAEVIPSLHHFDYQNYGIHVPV